jgi:hypothetical protein
MQGGKLMISRGVPAVEQAVPLGRRPEPSVQAPLQPVSSRQDIPASDIHLVDYRLAALERLSRLRDKGALSLEEFAAEKALVLALPTGEMELAPEQIIRPRGPSLLSRLFGWRMLAMGAAAGLIFSYVTAPQDLLGLVDRASRLLA